jgi:hypothetical protein
MPEDSSGIASSSDSNTLRMIQQTPRVGAPGDAVASIKPRLLKQGYVRFLTLADLDGRSRAAARCRELVRSFESDLGGADELSTAQRQLVQRAALLAVTLEDFEVRFTLGQPFELPDYLATVNAQRRVLITLGLERRARDVSNGRLPLRERLLAQMPADADAEVQDAGE